MQVSDDVVGLDEDDRQLNKKSFILILSNVALQVYPDPLNAIRPADQYVYILRKSPTETTTEEFFFVLKRDLIAPS